MSSWQVSVDMTMVTRPPLLRCQDDVTFCLHVEVVSSKASAGRRGELDGCEPKAASPCPVPMFLVTWAGRAGSRVLCSLHVAHVSPEGREGIGAGGVASKGRGDDHHPLAARGEARQRKGGHKNEREKADNSRDGQTETDRDGDGRGGGGAGGRYGSRGRQQVLLDECREGVMS